MFLLTRGVSERVWAEDPTVRFTLPQLQPELLCSDEDEDPAADVSHGKEENQWSGWVSGARARDAAKASGTWPDGHTIRKGHGSPYLKPWWAQQIRDGTKVFEGRPDEGVRLQTLTQPMPTLS